MAKPKGKDLVQIIRDNPGCRAVIDNDCWWIYAADAGDDDDPIVESDDIPYGTFSGGYGAGHVYGQDILLALAKIVGMKVESV